jgi:predicted esterase
MHCSRFFLGVLAALAWQGIAHADVGPNAAPRGAEWIPRDDTHPAAMVFAPDDTRTPRPVTIMLHGQCGAPENECPAFANAVTRDSWLICPRGGVECDNGGATWSSADRAPMVDAAIRAVAALHPGGVDFGARRTLVGFSLGAFIALDIAHHDPGKWPRLVLIAAKVLPEPSLLQKNGVERVLFASGSFDLSHAHMLEETRRLSAHGTTTTFMSLGPVGHSFARDMATWTTRAFDWLSMP